MKEIQFERGKADPQIYKDTKSQATTVFHVDDPILAASHQQTALVWNRIGKHMLLKAHEVMTHDRAIKYLSRQYLKVHAVAGRKNLDQQWDKLAKIREHWERMITRDTELELENCSS